MRILRILFLPFLIASCTYESREPVEPEPCDTEQVSYSNRVDGILEQHCGSCHRNGSRSGGIVLDSYEDVALLTEPNEPEASLLYGVVSHTFGKPMPNNSPKIPECDIQKIRAWIADGAKND